MLDVTATGERHFGRTATRLFEGLDENLDNNNEAIWGIGYQGNVAPTVNADTFAIDENSANSTVVGSVTATDPEPGTLNYAIIGGNTDGAFTINATTGQITVANSAALDFESTPVFNLTVAAIDAEGAYDSAIITVNVSNVNDAPVMNAWFNDAWDTRKGLTINAASVAGDVTDFPVLITLNVDAELAAQALANGDDILFTAADGTTQLAHEIEFFDETTGELRVWVKTDLSGSIDTNIFMYFGNAASGNQENIPGVWDNYVGVYHLGESPTGTPGELTDSSGSGNHATTEGAMDARIRCRRRSGRVWRSMALTT